MTRAPYVAAGGLVVLGALVYRTHTAKDLANRLGPGAGAVTLPAPNSLIATHELGTRSLTQRAT